MNHADIDTKSHIVRASLNSYRETVNIEYFKILNMEYNDNANRRRIPEALFVKQYLPSLNIQGNSVLLDLFNLF